MNELSAAFREALDSLRPEARLIIELRDFEGLNFDEIKQRVRRNKVDTVKAIYYRAKAKLTDDLGGHA